MFRYAQTNLQLYVQLGALGYDARALLRVREAHELAMRLVTGQHRATGKPFLCHLVGTASVLAEGGAGPDLVLAGLLHGAYPFGDFGRRDAGERPSKRAIVRSVIGEAAESIVSGYGRSAWIEPTFEDFERRASSLAPIERDLIALRLANDIEEHLDGAMRYAGYHMLEGRYAGVEGARARRLAERLGLERLAQALAESIAACGPRPAEALLRRDQRNSALISPASSCLRPSIALQRRLGDAKRWLAARSGPAGAWLERLRAPARPRVRRA